MARGKIPPAILVLDAAAKDEFNKVMDAAAEVLLHEEQNEVLRQDAFASETLLRSLGIQETLDQEGGLFRQLDVLPLDELVNVKPGRTPPSKYFYWVVHGRQPGSAPPPVAPIIEWMKARDIRPLEGTSEKDYFSAAFAIARVIGEEGIEGRPIPQEAMRRTKFRVVRMFELAAARVAKRAEAGEGGRK